ncbi:Glutathione transferase [Bertholletia excelsa]
MAEDLVLVNFNISPFGMRVRIALAEKGLEYEYKEENILSKSDLLFKINPVHKKVPVLIHKGKPVCESLIIVEYIDEVWKNKSPILPSDPYQRAHAKFWADYIEKKIFSLGKQVVLATEAGQEAANKELLDCFKLLEEELGDKPFFGGEGFGFVDLALVPFYSWFYTWAQCGLNVAEECPKLGPWARRCMERESVAQTLPDQHKVYAFFMEMKKRLAGPN